MEAEPFDFEDRRDRVELAEMARAAVEDHLSCQLGPDARSVTLSSLFAGAAVGALHAIARDWPDRRRMVAACAAAAAMPAPLQALSDALIEDHGEERDEIDEVYLDVSDIEMLIEEAEELIDDDERVDDVATLVETVLGGGTALGDVWETASYSPAHESNTLYLETFTWNGAVWYFGHGCPDAMESYEAEFLHRLGDIDGERAALVGIAGSWMGAGLENHDDPEVRSAARSASWLVEWDRFNWYEPFADWDVYGNYGSAEDNIKAYGQTIADRLGRDLSEVASALRTLDPPDEDEVLESDDENGEAKNSDAAGGRWGEDLPLFEQEVRQELWWILKRS